MLKIKQFTCNMVQENTYVVSDETRECVIIDCGAASNNEQQTIEQYIEVEQLKPVRLLSTHGHFDHNLGIEWVHQRYGLLPEVHERDKELITHLPEQMESIMQIRTNAHFPTPSKYLTENETISFGSHTIQIIPTPGHTKGCVCLYIASENVLFTGDTLFRGTIGRTDLPYGSMFEMTNSLRRLCQLPDQTKLYPGHGQTSTMALELSTNPFLDR